MKFQRARSAEQKALRINQIMDAAGDLMQTHAYRDITLDMIADRLDFSRANMARYAATKEEIFLMLYVREMTRLTDDLVDRYEKQGTMGIVAFSKFCTDIISRYPFFLRIGSILNTVIEMNITPERLAIYKADMHRNLDRMGEVICRNFSFLTVESSQELLNAVYALIAGLYPMANLSECQVEAMRICGVKPKSEFSVTLENYLVILLRGYEASTASA